MAGRGVGGWRRAAGTSCDSVTCAAECQVGTVRGHGFVLGAKARLKRTGAS